MLSLFRRLIYSKVGVIVSGIVLVLIALAFAGGDVSSLRTQGMAALGGGGDTVATIGKVTISAPEFKQRVQQEMEGYRQQQPTLDMAQFIAGGGLDATLQRLTNAVALEQFGRAQGMLVSRRAVDGQIASIPGLQGPSGQFDPVLFRQLLADRHLSEAGVRADLERDTIASQLTGGLLKPTTVPLQLALPYASLALEKRAGTIGLIPSKAMPTGPAPTPAELQAFYTRNIGRYTVPERRAIRYARVTPEQVAAQARPSEAEIAQAYAADRATYAATEKRTISQVVVLDQAGAQAIAAKVKGGTALAAAASAAGLEASVHKGVDRATYAGVTSPAVAGTVFGAARGAVVGPVKAPLGFVVAHVDAVEQVAGRTLAQVHDEIAATLTKQKTADALNKTHDAIDDSLAGNATFDEIVGDRKLQAATSPALLANGVNPDAPGQPDPTMAPLVAAAFKMQEGDEPQMVPTGPDGSFALVALGRVIHAAPRPLAQVSDGVRRDMEIERARLAARKVAGQVLAKVNGGATIAQALAATGLNVPPPHELAASREELNRAQGPSRAPLALMFAMTRGTAKILEAPGNAGWVIIKLDTITPGDAARKPENVTAIRGAFGQVIGREYLEQFAKAARVAVGVKVNQQVVDRVRAELLSGGGSNPN